MATHYCSKCGAFSFHGPGELPTRYGCPACGHVERQNPHPPLTDEVRRNGRSELSVRPFAWAGADQLVVPVAFEVEAPDGVVPDDHEELEST